MSFINDSINPILDATFDFSFIVILEALNLAWNRKKS